MDPLVRIGLLAAFVVSLVAIGAVLARFFLACPFCRRTRKHGPMPDFTCGGVTIRGDEKGQWVARVPGHGPMLLLSRESALEYALKQVIYELNTRPEKAEAARHA
jgi:hypothetical protein